MSRFSRGIDPSYNARTSRASFPGQMALRYGRGRAEYVLSLRQADVMAVARAVYPAAMDYRQSVELILRSHKTYSLPEFMATINSAIHQFSKLGGRRKLSRTLRGGGVEVSWNDETNFSLSYGGKNAGYGTITRNKFGTRLKFWVGSKIREFSIKADKEPTQAQIDELIASTAERLGRFSAGQTETLKVAAAPVAAAAPAVAGGRKRRLLRGNSRLTPIKDIEMLCQSIGADFDAKKRLGYNRYSIPLRMGLEMTVALGHNSQYGTSKYRISLRYKGEYRNLDKIDLVGADYVSLITFARKMLDRNGYSY